jgi:CBS domain-containing protein
MTTNALTAAASATPECPGANATAARAVLPALVASVDTIARSRLLRVGEDALLTEVANRLSVSRSGLAVVCDASGSVVGVITEALLVEQFGLGRPDAFCTRALDAMRRDFTTCVASDSLSDVLTMMHHKGLIHVVILADAGQPLGVLHARDGLRALLAAGNYEEELLSNYVTGVGYQ